MKEPCQLTAAEYEDFVSKLIQKLSFWKTGSVYKNRRYPGLRQPGEYEIDIAVEVELDGKIFFRLIVECKNWSRPVTRPVVQQLAQTRDAIGAHKAAIASPVGFSKEAMQVAKACGIALWVMTVPEVWDVMMACAGIHDHGVFSHDFFDLRSKLYAASGIEIKALDKEIRLVEAHNAGSRTTREDLRRWYMASKELGFFHGPWFISDAHPWIRFGSHLIGGSAIPWHEKAVGYDAGLVETQLIKEYCYMLHTSDNLDANRLRVWREEGKQILQACGVSPDEINSTLDKVIADDEESFLKTPTTYEEARKYQKPVDYSKLLDLETIQLERIRNVLASMQEDSHKEKTDW